MRLEGSRLVGRCVLSISSHVKLHPNWSHLGAVFYISTVLFIPHIETSLVFRQIIANREQSHIPSPSDVQHLHESVRAGSANTHNADSSHQAAALFLSLSCVAPTTCSLTASVTRLLSCLWPSSPPKSSLAANSSILFLNSGSTD